MCFFFFSSRRRHTRYWRDWSSDVCSSDYQLKAGSYCLYDMRETPSAITGERRCRLRTELVAIAFDLVTGQVHEHGSPTRIHAWALCTRRRLRAAGDWDRSEERRVGKECRSRWSPY